MTITPPFEATSEPITAESPTSELQNSPEHQGAHDPASEAEGSATVHDAPPAQELDLLRAEAIQLKDQLLRAVAEQENIRRRSDRDKQDAMRYAISDFAKALVSVADTFERAISSVTTVEGEAHPPLVHALLEGIQLTEAELLKVFERFGIQKHTSEIGEKFDPNRHQAMFEMPHETPAGHVAQVIQQGYTHHDRLLRPSMVGVSKGPETASSDSSA